MAQTTRFTVVSVQPLTGADLPAYERHEWRLVLRETPENPFDPASCAPYAVLQGPRGRHFTVPAFWYADCQRKMNGPREEVQPVSPCEWRVRFALPLPGRWTVRFGVRASDGDWMPSHTHTLTSRLPVSRGYVRVDSRDRTRLRYDDGSLFLPVGANICWGSWRGTYDYDDWLPEYAKAGCNAFRLWLAPHWVTCALERPRTADGQLGLGRFDLANAWRLDYILDRCYQLGLYVQPAISSFSELRWIRDGFYGEFERTQYWKENGGPLSHPSQFWTHPAVRNAYLARLRYLVARWGYSTHIYCWEFWNEVDGVTDWKRIQQLARGWHRDMARHLRSIDPWAHPITTSFANSNGWGPIDSLPEIEIIQTHNYGAADITAMILEQQKNKASLRKPHHLGEFGVDAGGADASVDPKGEFLHTGIWTSALSSLAGSGFSWWWDNHIHPHGLYPLFAHLNKFIQGLQNSRAPVKPVQVSQIRAAEDTTELPRRDLMITGPVTWDPHIANRPTELRIDNQGKASTSGMVAGILHGTKNHPTLHNPLTLIWPTGLSSRLILNITGVSGYGGARLQVERDGEMVLDRDLADGTTHSEGVRTEFNGMITIDLPASTKRVVIRNVGTDWVQVNYLIEAIRISAPDLQVLGLQTGQMAWIWASNADYTRQQVIDLQRTVPAQPASIISIQWRPGTWLVRTYDPRAGEWTGSQTVSVHSDRLLNIPAPRIHREIAWRVEPVRKS